MDIKSSETSTVTKLKVHELAITQRDDEDEELKVSYTNMTASSVSSMSSGVGFEGVDPFKMLFQVRQEYIFVFSGFNEKKLLHCEVFDVQRNAWSEIASISNARTKFAAVPISKTRILIFGGKQSDG